MRAAIVEGAGPPESFRIVDLPIPKPKESEVIIRQMYAAVNFGDVIRRKRGIFPSGTKPPYVLGFEGIGEIVGAGANVDSYRIGDRVAYLGESGGYGEYVSVAASSVWRPPETLKADEAAGIGCVGLTAWGLADEAQIRPGETAVVHGAAGGVGSILVQILTTLGARVVAIVAGADKATFASTLGGDMVVDRQASDAVERIQSFTGDTGADVVFDCIGQDALELNLKSIRKGGRWFYYGSTSGHAQFPGDRLLMHSLEIRGFVVFDYVRERRHWQEGTSYLRSALTRGILRPTLTAVLPLTEVSNAHRRLESREVIGKQVLKF